MNRGVRKDNKKISKGNNQDTGEKQKKNLLKRSQSKSRSRSPQRNLLKSPQRSPQKSGLNKLQKSGKDQNKRNRSPSLARSGSKSQLKKSLSSKKIKRGASQQKVIKNKNQKKLNRSSSLKNSGKVQISPEKSAKRIINKEQKKQPIGTGRKPQPTIRQQQKDMGLILNFPEQEKVLLKQIDALDQAYDKFFDMVINDNDASYVMNALPQLRDLKKQDDSQGRDFISGKITRLSGVFDNLNVDKISGPLRKVPFYYTGQCGKNLILCKLCLMTKFKIQVDLGFLQYSLDGDKITIFRIYLSKIYRKMNYVAFVYLQVLKMLLEKHPAADRWSIFILERNMSIHKFFKYMGLKIEKIVTDSKNKHQVDYYQQFSIKKKQLQAAISAFK